MIETTADDIAQALAQAHRMRAANGPAPAVLVGDLGLAYAVQDRLVTGWREDGEGAIFGWKIGMTTSAMQARTGMSEPAAGAILARRARSSGAILAVDDFVHLGLEGEIAVRVGEAFVETEPVDAATALGRLESIAAAFEVTDDRHADWSRLEAATLIADNIWNMGVVLGPPTPASEIGGLTGRRGVVRINGVRRDEGYSQDIGCDPAKIIAWLGAHLAQRGQPLQPGQWIMTGSFVPTTFPQAGDRYGFEVEGLAPVDVILA